MIKDKINLLKSTFNYSEEDKDIQECLDVLNNLEKHIIIIDGKIFFQACVLQAVEKINNILGDKWK